MSKSEKILSTVDAVPSEVIPTGAHPYGTVFTDEGEVDNVKSIDRQGVEAMIGVPAVNWRGLPDPQPKVAVPATPDVTPKPKRGRPKKKVD